MKIVHACLCGPFYEKYAYQDNLLPKYHKRLGHDVTIITTPYGKFIDGNSRNEIVPACEYRLDDGTMVVRLRAVLPQIINTHVYLYRGFHKALEVEHPDYIFVHGVESLNYISLNKYKKEHPDVIIVFDNHTDKINSLHHWVTKLWSIIVVKGIIVKKLIPVGKWFYGTTPVRSTFLMEHYGIPERKIKLLLLGADDDSMHYDKKAEIRRKIRMQYNVSDDDFLVVTGGKIDRNKNIDKLVSAISKIDDPKLKVIVFGSINADLKDFFDSIKSERIMAIGWIPANSVYEFFYAADLVAFPGLHSVMWEQAIASRVPCVFNRIKGFEHVNFNHNCLWFESANEDELRNVIKTAYTDKEGYRKLLTNANSDLASVFLYSVIAMKTIEDITK